jgi:hypothetical protein
MLEELVSAHTKGDPETTLLWTNKSLRNLEKGLAEKGYKASYRVVGEMLKMLGYGLQADKKTLTLTESHADRDAQFEYINRRCKLANAEGIPVLTPRRRRTSETLRTTGKHIRSKVSRLRCLTMISR